MLGMTPHEFYGEWARRAVRSAFGWTRAAAFVAGIIFGALAALHAGRDYNSWLWAVSILLFVAALLYGFITVPYQMYQELEHELQQRPTPSPPLTGARITVQRVFLPGQLSVGFPIVCQAILRNSGDMEARVNTVGNALPADAPPSDPFEETRFADRLWRDQFLPAVAAMGNVAPNRIVRPGESFEHDNAGPILTHAEGERILEHTRAIYFVGIVRYEDATGRHHTDYCRYFTARISGDDLFVSGAHNQEHAPVD